MDTTDRIRRESRRDPDLLASEIDAQRDHIAALVDTLAQRISPTELAGPVLHAVRANPVPSLLTAAGLAWLYAQRDQPLHEDDAAMAGDGLGTRVGDKASAAKDFTRRKAQDARLGFDHMLEDNPIAVGALGVAAGALLGAMLPATASEDRWLGEMRERVARDLKDGAREATRADGARADGDGRGTLHH